MITKKLPSGFPERSFTVRPKGLEPPRLSAPDPKSGAATNYATAANGTAKIRLFMKWQIQLLNFFTSESITSREMGILQLMHLAGYFNWSITRNSSHRA